MYRASSEYIDFLAANYRCDETGITPRYHPPEEWRVYCRHVPAGFTTANHCTRIAATQPYY